MPDFIHNIGIEVVLFMQSLGSWLLLPLLFFSFLGTEGFYLLVAPAIYWCISASTGLRMGLYLSLSVGLNAFLKIAFHSPRPYWYDRRVAALSTETTFGMPSGHAQNSVVVWGSLAASVGKAWAWAAAIVLSIIIGISRIYLGVHFPSDVLAGWLVGVVLLWILLKVEPQVLGWMKKKNIAVQIAVVFAASILLIALAVVARLALINWEIPVSWIENARAANPDADPIDPFAFSGLISNAAVFFGLSVGGIWINSRGGFVIHGTWWQLLLRYIFGLIGVLVFWFGLGQIFPDGEEALHIILRFIRYALVGMWVTGFAPMLFIKLRLSELKTKK
jgi:membrane-associated phospholipid phosphatase